MEKSTLEKQKLRILNLFYSFNNHDYLLFEEGLLLIVMT